MDSERFDTLARTVGDLLSRRAALRVVRTAVFGAAVKRVEVAQPVLAAKGSKVRAADVVQTESLFGCKNVGELCKGNDSVCCSGTCVGKKPKKKKKGKK